ncbi:MAG: DUF342 domain-containing protein [Phycisphaerales bacterium]
MSAGPEHSMVRVVVPTDGMTATLTLLACAANACPGVETCIGALREKEVVVDDNVEFRVRELVEEHGADPTTEHEAVVAAGREPAHGRDGSFELVERLAAQLEPTPSHDEDEPVDYYNRKSFHVVRAGETIGRLVEPTAGRAGLTVAGKEIAPRTGKACEVRVEDGASLQGDLIVADVTGALRHEGGAIGVDEVLEISGPVDYETGNIEFPGDVIVREGVCDCFRVVGERDVTVLGVVEAATIRAERDASLLGGMAGREKGELSVGRDLEARYLGMVSGVVGRHATVEREVVDCDLEVRGRFHGERCAIVGGRLAIRASSEVGEIGRYSGVRTEVVIGRAPSAERLASKASGLLESIRKHEEQARARGGPGAHGDHAGMRDRLSGAVDALRSRFTPARDIRLQVLRQIHAGSVIYIGGFELAITRTLRGPLSVSMDLGGFPRIVDASGKPLETTSFGKLRSLDDGAGEQAA